MIDKILGVLDKLPPLKKEKNPNVAAIIGFFLGGIGLLIYGFSFIDLLIGIAITIVAWLSFQNIDPLLGYFSGMIIAGLYGYFRALNSNRRLIGEFH
jgi:hypothetical protein